MKGEIRTASLPVPLTQEEQLQRGERMGIVLHEINELEARKKAANDLAKTEKERLETELHQLGAEMKAKAKIVEVEVKDRPDWKEGKIETIRMDTGEIVRVRDMTATERQRSFAINEN